jgi:hypothetical protein
MLGGTMLALLRSEAAGKMGRCTWPVKGLCAWGVMNDPRALLMGVCVGRTGSGAGTSFRLLRALLRLCSLHVQHYYLLRRHRVCPVRNNNQ